MISGRPVKTKQELLDARDARKAAKTGAQKMSSRKHDRTKAIDAAIAGAKVRDKFRSLLSGKGPMDGVAIEGAHLLVRNAPYPRWDPTNKDFIMTLTREEHRGPGGYDENHSIEGKRAWLIKQAKKRKVFEIFLQRFNWLVGEE